MSGLFKILEGERAVVREGGVYKEVELAVRNDGELYVKSKGGFVRLMADGTSSLGAKLTLDTLTLDAPYHKDLFGKLCISPAPDRKALSEPVFLKLEGPDT